MDKSLAVGSTALLLLGLLSDGDKYGYQMIEELERRSDNTFSLKAGTLYPLLHTLEQQGLVQSYDGEREQNRPRRYYRLTDSGRAELSQKKAEFRAFVRAVDRVIGKEGGIHCEA